MPRPRWPISTTTSPRACAHHVVANHGLSRPDVIDDPDLLREVPTAGVKRDENATDQISLLVHLYPRGGTAHAQLAQLVTMLREIE